MVTINQRLSFGLFVFFATVLSCIVPFQALANQQLTVEQGKSILLPDVEVVETVFVSDTNVADATVSPNNQIFVYGKVVGETTLIATSLDGQKSVSYTIRVKHRLTELRSLIKNRFPDQAISLESSRGSLLVSGGVSSEQVRATVLSSLQAAVGDSTVIDRLTVQGSNTIRLDVLLLEVSRSKVDNLGIDWNATVANNGFSIGTSGRGTLSLNTANSALDTLNATVDVLVTNNVASIVQETSLSTVTGEQAEFTVGSEIPVPAFEQPDENGRRGSFQLDYRFIGTRLTFTPTIAPGNKLRMLIDSEISSDAGQSSSVNGNNFPTLTSRSFRTSVELKDRRSFVIAGISRNDANGDLRTARKNGFSRAIDTLFGRDAISRSSQELVVIVTPVLNEQDASIDIARSLPKRPSNLDFIFSTTPSGKRPGNSQGMPGSAGFKY